MLSLRRSSVLSVPILMLCSATFGCSSQGTPPPATRGSASNSDGVASRLRAIVAGKGLADQRWPNFTDYRQESQQLYAATSYAPVWVRDGQATPQALAVIAALESSQQKGLNPEDYDGLRWPQRLSTLKIAPGDADAVAHFDAALTVSAMRYISDLHVGRVNPKHFEFGIDVEQKRYDLPQFLAHQLLGGSNVAEVLNEVEPPYFAYQRTEAALQMYLALAAQDHSLPLPELQKTLVSGDSYAAVEGLAQRLHLLGDLPQSAFANMKSGIYDGALVDAVKRFQSRHGLGADGKLDKKTVQQLNVPLNFRVQQLEDALERWRWLPADFSPLPVAVNIPEFVLRVFSADHRIALRMNVVVGNAVRHETPVFGKDMKYIIFRPYWNVPFSITRAEIIPAVQKDSSYLARKDFEITDQSGRIVSSGAVSADVLAQLRSGKLLVRQKPGPGKFAGASQVHVSQRAQCLPAQHTSYATLFAVAARFQPRMHTRRKAGRACGMAAARPAKVDCGQRKGGYAIRSG